MANVTINDEHLIAIGEALRGKLGETRVGETVTQEDLPIVQKSSGATGHDSLGSVVTVSSAYKTYTIPGAASILTKCTCNLNSTSCNLEAKSGTHTSWTSGTGTKLFLSIYNIGSPQYNETTFSNTDTITIYTYYTMAYYLEIFGLDADGNVMAQYEVVTEGEIPNTFKPRDMAAAIISIPEGGGSGSSSALPTPPEGGWVWSNSPWRCAFRNVISSTVQSLNRDYWVFDVSECDELTITVTTPKAASSSTTSSIYGVAVYGKNYELTSAGASGDAQYTITQVDATTKEDSRVTVASGSNTNVRTYTGTFNVKDYTVFALRLYPAYGSSSAPDHIACYVSNLSYT